MKLQFHIKKTSNKIGITFFTKYNIHDLEIYMIDAGSQTNNGLGAILWQHNPAYKQIHCFQSASSSKRVYSGFNWQFTPILFHKFCM